MWTMTGGRPWRLSRCGQCPRQDTLSKTPSRLLKGRPHWPEEGAGEGRVVWWLSAGPTHYPPRQAWVAGLVSCSVLHQITGYLSRDNWLNFAASLAGRHCLGFLGVRYYLTWWIFLFIGHQGVGGLRALSVWAILKPQTQTSSLFLRILHKVTTSRAEVRLVGHSRYMWEKRTCTPRD